jgi:hypothetical protein
VSRLEALCIESGIQQEVVYEVRTSPYIQNTRFIKGYVFGVSNAVSYGTMYCVCYQASHIDERDRDGGREGGRDGGRDRDRGEEHYPRASGGYSGSGRNTEDGTGGHAAHDDRKALQTLMRGLAESDAEMEVGLY